MSSAQKVTALYLRTLSRSPTADELAEWVKYLDNPPPLADADPTRSAPVRKNQAGPFRPRNPTDPLARANDRVPETREPRIAAVEDLMWTLLNSSEFALNH
jgi:hypothetical protein